MQLRGKLFLLLICGLCLAIKGFGQSNAPSLKTKSHSIDFLFSYYDQDGQHSAVTGGEGTEKLEEFESKIILNVPKDSVTEWSLNTGLSYYTSASNDKIDFAMSSASKKEFRAYVGYDRKKKIKDSKQTVGYNLYTSIEVDYFSSAVGGFWSKEYKDGNRILEVDGKFYYDIWVWTVFPQELRNRKDEWRDGNKRLTYFGSVNLSQVFNKKLQGSVSADLVYQHGLLFTPFHRTYFTDNTLKVEKLPKDRFKLPIGFRLNFFASDWVVLRSYYRYYIDSYSIHASTFALESHFKVGRTFSFYPFYRYHTQSGAKYFAPRGEHFPTATYFTSDYDLSSFDSNKWGFGLRIAPPLGIGRSKPNVNGKTTIFRNVDLRFAKYKRSDGLDYFMITGAFGLDIW